MSLSMPSLFQGHYFNQAKAIKEEIQASNGVVYLISEVLAVPEGTIYNILGNQDYNISMFRDLVDRAHFGSSLNRSCKLFFMPRHLEFERGISYFLYLSARL